MQIFCFLEQPCSHKSFVLSPRGSFPGCKIRAFFFVFHWLKKMPLLENSLLFFCFFSLPFRSHKGLPFMHQIDEKFHTPSKKHWRNWEHHIKVVTWMCFTLVGCGRGLLIHFAPNSTLFPQHRGAAQADIHASLQKSICFPENHSPIRFSFGNTAVCLSHLEWQCWKDLPWKSSVFFLYLGGLVTYRPKRGLEKQNHSCTTAHWNLAYSLPNPSRAPRGLCARGFTSMSATFVKKNWNTV